MKIKCDQANYKNTVMEVEPKITDEILGNLVLSILEKSFFILRKIR